jgi:3-oxoacyl-[acyl-carrier-protein] synthase II
MMVNSISGELSIMFGLRGQNYSVVSACCSAAHAIALAAKAIADGSCDLALTGGSEAAVTRLGMGGFASMKALSLRNDEPHRASRPFDRDRDGFVMGEGAGIMILEEEQHARRRGARIYAELLGSGFNGDAHHITAPHPDGKGAARAITLCLADARIAAEAVSYVNAHGTSTPYNDRTETLAIKHAFGAHAQKLAISSTKSMIGHLLGASGGAELVATALAIHHGVAHPTANLENPDPDCDLDYIPGSAREMKIEAAVSNSFGFGGHNVSLCLGRYA